MSYREGFSLGDITMKLSLLNLVPVRAGQTYKDAIDS
jgi:hypothetical protein